MKKRNEKEEKIEEISILIFGDEKVGKTSLTLKYVGKYSEVNISIKKMQTGLSTEEKSIKIKGKEYKLLLYDPTPDFLQNVDRFNWDGIMFVYDITIKDSRVIISDWIQLFRNKRQNFPMILLGNKVDLIEQKEREMEEKEGNKFAKENEIDFFVTSCKDGTNINDAVDSIFNKILEEKEKEKANYLEESELDMDKKDDNRDDNRNNSFCCDFCSIH